MPLLSTNIVDVLSILETSIENKYQQVSHRIVTGENARQCRHEIFCIFGL